MRHERQQLRARLDGLAAAQQFFAEWFGETDSTRETLWVAHLDDQADCVHLSRFDGKESAVEAPIRSIIQEAIRHCSAGMLLAHNHPSGDPRPSHSDRRLTRRLVTVAEALECNVVDHLIFAGEYCASFRKMGLL